MGAVGPRGVRRRRLYAAVIGVVLTSGLLFNAHRATGVYLAQADVIFLLPPYPHRNTLQETTDSVITVAGVVALEVNAGHPQTQTASETVTLVDQGVRHGYLVRLPNAGGQWATNFNEPTLDVEAVGTSAAEATATISGLLRQILTNLAALQPGVPLSQLITTKLNPTDPSIYYDSGSRSRALLASLALGVGLTAGGIPAAEALLARRRRRPVVL